MKLTKITDRTQFWRNKTRNHSDEELQEHCCANCGHVFKGNYCPICRQEAGDGRITWRSVWKNIVSVWGLDSRSLPNTLWQLLVRPGRHIGAYISGHRQSSYSPANMLFIVAVFYVAIKYLFNYHNTIKVYSPEIKSDILRILYAVFSWVVEQPGWITMGLTLIMILPTWFLFHFSPRHTRHTLPEGIFIQLFMSTLMLLIASTIRISNGWTFLLIPFYYFFCYRQLFGYRFWGTLWRTALCFIIWVIVVINILAIVLFVSSILIPELQDNIEMRSVDVVFIIIFQALLLIANLALGYWISKRTSVIQNCNTENT